MRDAGRFGLEVYLDFAASWRTFDTGEHEIERDGVKLWKLADDLERYEAALRIARPEVVVEVGSKWGGTALWFAEEGDCEVIAVDIDNTYRADLMQAQPPRIAWVTGNSIDPAVVSQVRELVAGRTCLVSLDGEHAAPHVKREIELYGPLVTPGSYLVVEDGIFDLAPVELCHRGGMRIPAEGGPLQAIAETLIGDEAWMRDFEIELLTERTYHPAGFWQRLDRGV